MDMVAEAKKRVGWDAVTHPSGGYTTVFGGKEDGSDVIADIPRGMEIDGQFIANAPAFIVAQDKRIKELETRYASYRVLCNKSIDEYKSVVRAFLKALDEQGGLWNETVQQQLYALKDLVA